MSELVKHVQVIAGSWRTLEAGWNIAFRVRFVLPAAAAVKVRYGLDFAGWDEQLATLNGNSPAVLSVGGASILFARVQIKVVHSTVVGYSYIVAP